MAKEDGVERNGINCEKPIYRNFQPNHWKYWKIDIEIFTFF